MYSYRVNELIDQDFFSAPRYDAVSLAPIKSGDVVCVCGKCEELFLESSWEANDQQCCACGSSLRKNIDHDYFHKYKVATQKVETRRNYDGVKRSRRNMVKVNSNKEDIRCVKNTSEKNTRRNMVEINERGRMHSGTGTEPEPISFSRPTVTPQTYPNKRIYRSKKWRILLGILVALIVIGVIAGVCISML